MHFDDAARDVSSDRTLVHHHCDTTIRQRSPIPASVSLSQKLMRDAESDAVAHAVAEHVTALVQCWKCM